MYDLPIHPAIVHLPLGLALVMPLIAGALLAAIELGKLPRRAWWLAVGLQALVLGSALLAARTGQGDEEIVEEFVPESAIEAHEERAEVFVWASGALLLLFATAGAMRRQSTARGLAAAATAGALVTAGLGISVGHAGGELVYRHDAAAAHAPGGDGRPISSLPGSRHEEDEDDD